ncbi:bile acid:sodium symporter family protein [Nocardiopsis dassonvillei]|uniref:Bile acid:sodium symporter n=1 Tax=Nocardiopsis dassonvillei (strain ATCC 23218 / DSM 43111 / CIP 107115 / JCM 7437 / KCTC 9190 / NBRC 14626 / NCTC 10488 / NRRL B-5397 / IMRU 509) TaxID=446468 RepID=D7AZN6_NOCDD|nr:bile acid:sodium symporter family protein [Nocardiopsis dassonvillei]ADH68157.1 Bile acid:sodium symporter [Nocardiopsis dassonvillei subsp. dassonvillei DSM 43111]NKY77197.1 bile acid:sodium symporter family protein [Nocardiopsis dassonvillei]VEI88660.1 bile acid transporter [Nocardiopsis dassonvillei]
MSVLTRVADFVGRWFALLVLAGGIAGLAAPGQAALLAPYISLLLGVIMFGMGLTMRPVDFAIVARHPKAVVLGVLAQYTVMPLLGWGIAHLLNLPPLLVVGMILVGSSPGGTASNVIVYLARGDVALSVAMTSISTLIAPVLTPLLVLALAGSTLPVAAGDLFVSILQVVLVPVLAGLLLRMAARRFVERVLPVLPLVSVLGIVVVVAAVVGANADAVLSSGLLVALAVVLHNSLGLTLGYLLGVVTKLPETARRAVSVEVGMQNSGLAAALATAHFAPLAALPGALFSVWHNISGALVATYWARRPPADVPAESEPTGSGTEGSTGA